MLVEKQRLPKEVHLAQAGLTDLPNGWEVIEVGDLLSNDRGISVGVMYPGNHDPLGIPLIKVGDMTGSIINSNPKFRISPAVHEEYSRTEFKGGELLLTLVGGLGQCAVVPATMAGWNAARALAVIRLKDQSDAPFLRLCLLSEPLQHLINAWANTTVQATLNLKEIRQLPVPWPPKRERDAIARIACSLDDEIELNRRMNETLEALARTLFNRRFVHELEGGLPTNWRESTIGAELTALLGGTPSRSEPKYWKNGTISWINSGKANEFRVTEPSEFITQSGLENSATKLLPARTTVIAITGATLGQVSLTEIETCANQSVVGVLGSEQLPSEFVYFWVKENIEDLISWQTGGAQQHINTDNVKALRILCPPNGDMRSYIIMVRPIFDLIKNNCFESRTLAALRDALLPKLLSGAVRVTNLGKVQGAR